jgi:hypothetical protein
MKTIYLAVLTLLLAGSVGIALMHFNRVPPKSERTSHASSEIDRSVAARRVPASEALVRNKPEIERGSGRSLGDATRGVPEWVESGLRKAYAEGDTQTRLTMIGDIAREWASVDLAASLQWAEGLKNPMEKTAAMVPVVSVMLNGSAEVQSRAFACLNEMGQGQVKDLAIAVNFRRLHELDPEAAIKLAASISGEAHIGAVATMLARSNDGISNADHYMEILPMGELRNGFAISVAEELANSDPQEAMAWLARNSDFDGADGAYARIGTAYAKQNPTEGIEFAQSIADSSARRAFLGNLYSTWGSQAPEAASEWLMKTIGSGGFDGSVAAAEAILPSVFRWDHESAFTAIENMPPSTGREELLVTAIRSLAEVAPSEAAQRLLVNPIGNDESRGDAIKDVMEKWMRRDSVAASQWVGSIANGRDQDLAIGVLVGEVLEKDHDFSMAETWAERISDDGVREKVLKQVEAARIGSKN